MANENKEIWEQWSDKHTEPDQLKRQGSATTNKLTPVSIDPIKGTATFKGSSGLYNTSLSECECTDFQRRNLPCKHMYRLSHELQLFKLPGTVQLFSAPPLNKAEAMNLIKNSLTEEEQCLFKNFCYICGNNNSGEELLSSDFADKLINCGLACLVENVETLLTHLPMNDVRKFLPPKMKSPRKKADLISVVAPLVNKEDIVFADGQKCLTLAPNIAHLGHALHRQLCQMYPESVIISHYDQL